MRTMKIASFAAIIAIGLSSQMISPANAVSEPSEITSAKEFMTEFNVPQETQLRLIEEYLAGNTWDSMTPGETPVDTVSESNQSGDFTISTFADGSVSVSKIEHATQIVNPWTRGISGCSKSGTQYNNCRVDMWVGLVSLSFYASYNLSTNRVTNGPWGGGYTIGGACSAYISYIGRPAVNIGQMIVQAQMCGIPYSTWFELRLTVTGGRAVVSWT